MTREEMIEAMGQAMRDYALRNGVVRSWDDYAQAALFALEAMGCVVQAWQGIESAKKQQGPYLLYAWPLTIGVGDWDGPSGRWFWRDAVADLGPQPTHWMPLPTPPLAAASPLSAPGRG